MENVYKKYLLILGFLLIGTIFTKQLTEAQIVSFTKDADGITCSLEKG
jgi:hypothetical protein